MSKGGVPPAPSPPIPIRYPRRQEDVEEIVKLEQKTIELKHLIDEAFEIVSPKCESMVSIARSALASIRNTVLRRPSISVIHQAQEVDELPTGRVHFNEVDLVRSIEFDSRCEVIEDRATLNDDECIFPLDL
jgi:hypothetical protein